MGNYNPDSHGLPRTMSLRYSGLSSTCLLCYRLRVCQEDNASDWARFIFTNYGKTLLARNLDARRRGRQLRASSAAHQRRRRGACLRSNAYEILWADIPQDPRRFECEMMAEAAGLKPGVYTLRIFIKEEQSKAVLTKETIFEVVP